MNKQTEKIIEVFKKYGGKAQTSLFHKGVEIKEQPTGLTEGFGGFCHIRESTTKEGKQLFSISMVGTWLSLSSAEDYQKQLSIGISVLKELALIDPEIVDGGLKIVKLDKSE
jgi:hypothetical protein